MFPLGEIHLKPLIFPNVVTFGNAPHVIEATTCCAAPRCFCPQRAAVPPGASRCDATWT